MYHNHVFRNMDEALPKLFLDLIEKGEEVGSRGGTRTLELTHMGITLTNPKEREILVPNRKVNLAAQIAETMWVLSGKNDVEFLSHYLPRAEQFSDDGEVWRGGYGPRLRNWVGFGQDVTYTDQLAEVVKILQEDPTSRRAVMSIFDPASDYQDSKDIPCNNWLSFSSRLGKLDLHVGIRSNDAMWGFSGINAFEWSVLQEVVAGLLGISVGSLHFSTTSFHLYDQHWAKAAQIAHQDPAFGVWTDSPRFELGEDKSIENLDDLFDRWFKLEEVIRTGSDPYAGGDIDRFPEPMLRSWLRILEWWWSGNQGVLRTLDGTRLAAAALSSVQPKREIVTGPVAEDVAPSPFIEFCVDLHSEKDAAYGDSWKKRGEMMAIMANIARKVDRLGGGETKDETSADTAIDLMIYLAKYRWWLVDGSGAPYPVPGLSMEAYKLDNPVLVGKLLRHVEASSTSGDLSQVYLTELIKSRFEGLAELAEEKDSNRYEVVDLLLDESYKLAESLWKREHWAKGNSTRSWDPEKGNWVYQDHPARIVKDNPQA